MSSHVYYNIECIMFDLCNMKCKFCFESENGNRTNDIDFDYIRNLPKVLIDEHLSVLEEKGVTDINLSAYGGELFLDGFPDELFDLYQNLVEEFKRLLKEKYSRPCNVTSTWLTNGIFTKYERVEKFLNAVGGELCTSYDLVDRFETEKQREIWHDFFVYFKSRIKSVTLTLTKGNIKALCSGADEYFWEITKCPEICIDISYYFPLNNNYVKFMPNDNEVYNFYEWAIKNRLFTCNVIDSLMATVVNPENVNRYCHCLNGVSAFRAPDNSTIFANGCFEVVEKMLTTETLDEFYDENIDLIKLSNGNVVDKRVIGAAKRGCFMCDYFNRCQRACYMILLHREYQLIACPLKRAYKFIETHPDIIKDYKEWRSKYESVTFLTITLRKD